MNRRNFLKSFLTLWGLSLSNQSFIKEDFSLKSKGNIANKRNWEVFQKYKKEGRKSSQYAILFDVSKCIGCRRCEWACNEWNKNPNQPLDIFEKSRFEKTSVFDKIRRTSAGSFTVVNRFVIDGKTYYVKKQCMHCEDPACASACFVGAFIKTKEGAVLYNPSVCVGCRYCMIACPFDIPAYEYYDPITPQVTKCTMCFDRITEGKAPACVSICSSDALKFGKKEDIIKLARQIITNNPDKYVNKVYGENDFGGTSWLYISPVPFEKLGFPKSLKSSPANYTRNFLFAVKVLEIFLAPPLVYLSYKALYKTSSSKKEKEDEQK
jgi:Fe-S-cluster-containing dehydrogenase component